MESPQAPRGMGAWSAWPRGGSTPWPCLNGDTNLCGAGGIPHVCQSAGPWIQAPPPFAAPPWGRVPFSVVAGRESLRFSMSVEGF